MKYCEYTTLCACEHKCPFHSSFSFLCKMCSSAHVQTHSSKCVCVCVRLPFYRDVCKGPSRGAKSKASGHNWVTGAGDGLKHGLGDAAATLGCLRCQGQSALINRLGPYITALVVLAAWSRRALWAFLAEAGHIPTVRLPVTVLGMEHLQRKWRGGLRDRLLLSLRTSHYGHFQMFISRPRTQ